MEDDNEAFVEGEEPPILDESVEELQKEYDRIELIEDPEERLLEAKKLMGRLSNG